MEKNKSIYPETISPDLVVKLDDSIYAMYFEGATDEKGYAISARQVAASRALLYNASAIFIGEKTKASLSAIDVYIGRLISEANSLLCGFVPKAQVKNELQEAQEVIAKVKASNALSKDFALMAQALEASENLIAQVIQYAHVEPEIEDALKANEALRERLRHCGFSGEK
jgi:hypothetical protein